MTAISTLLPGHVVQPLGWTLLHFVWQGLAAWLLLAMFLRLLRRASANARYLAGCVGLALMVALPVATFGRLYATPSAPAWSAPAAQAPLARTADPVSPAPGVKSTSVRAARSLQDPGPPLAPPWHVTARAWCEARLAWLVTGWLTGVLVLAAWMLFGWVRLQSWRHRLVAPLARQWQAVGGELAERLRVRRCVRVLESKLADVPTAFGWLRPVILLPARALTSLAPEQLRALLAHELAHIKRYDYLVNLVQSALETLLFYHPAVWWLSRRIRVEREHCCDDLAVAVCGSPAVYVGALASAAELARLRPHLRVAASGGVLLGRIRRLVGTPARQGQGPTAWVAAVLVVAMLVGGLASIVWSDREARAQAQAEGQAPALLCGATSLGVPLNWPEGLDTSQLQRDPAYSPSGRYLAFRTIVQDAVILDFAAGQVYSVAARWGTVGAPHAAIGRAGWLDGSQLLLTEHWVTPQQWARVDQKPRFVQSEWAYRAINVDTGSTTYYRPMGTNGCASLTFVAAEGSGRWLVTTDGKALRYYDPALDSIGDPVFEASGAGERLRYQACSPPWVCKVILPEGTHIFARPFDAEFANLATGEVRRVNGLPALRGSGPFITADGAYVLSGTYDGTSSRMIPVVVRTATGTTIPIPQTESWIPAALSEARGVVLGLVYAPVENDNPTVTWYEIPLATLLGT